MKMQTMLDPQFMKQYRDRIDELTAEDGDRQGWCPYPADLFANVVIHADDVTARQLIDERRKYYFPDFLRGEPQYDTLVNLAQKFELTM